MIEFGVQKPPSAPLIDELELWANWEIWFSLVRKGLPKVQTFTVTINPTAVNANTTSAQTFSVPGLTTNDIVKVNKPSHTAGLVIGNARVSATDTLEIQFGNLTGASIDPPSEAYYIVAIRR